eukprot:scaffold212203_cov33-Tisochrysis_lutea.AAC.7
MDRGAERLNRGEQCRCRLIEDQPATRHPCCALFRGIQAASCRGHQLLREAATNHQWPRSRLGFLRPEELIRHIRRRRVERPQACQVGEGEQQGNEKRQPMCGYSHPAPTAV